MTNSLFASFCFLSSVLAVYLSTSLIQADDTTAENVIINATFNNFADGTLEAVSYTHLTLPTIYSV